MGLNDLFYGITRRLNELFEDGVPIYTDAVEQGLSEPCFFVAVLEPERRPMLGGRSFQENGFCIQYIPGAPMERSRELNRIADTLMDGMEFLALENGELVHGTGRRFCVVDGVLNFFVHYNMFLVPRGAPNVEVMDELEMKGRI